MNRDEARNKAKALVSRMTLEEKCSQMRYDAPAIERLGIPAYNWWNEALHGVARAGQATVFPQAIGIGASFDPELAGEMADVIAEEGRAKFNAYSSREDRDIYKGLTFWAPNVNIFRDPRWGRGHETYGEDPCLTAQMGVSFVKHLQGSGETMKAAACAKHFAVHSGPEGIRHGFDARVNKKDMEETYFPAFRALVQDAKVEAVMGAYNAVNGEPSCASPFLQQKLRGEWGFEGHFVSDCWAIRDFHEFHMVTATEEESAALAANNGCDLNCGSTYLRIQKAVEDGLVQEETVTEAVTRLFTTRYLLGLFDGSEYDSIPYTQVESPAHLALAQKAAEESFVLLKNNGLLPLDKKELKTVGIIGPNADSRTVLTGNYHGTAGRYVTVQEGIQDYLGEEVRVLTSVGCDLFRDRTESLAQHLDRLEEARTVAMNSDVVILCVGLDETLEGEEGDTGNSYASGDKIDLQLPESQRSLMEAVASCGRPTVLCLMAGSDIDLSYAAEHFDAVMVLWYPGCRGGAAAARVLFGEVSPSGKLPVTFYDPAQELPAFEDYSMKGRTYRYLEGKAQYPFGYGLTYGHVTVKEAGISESDPADDKEPVVTVQSAPRIYCDTAGVPWQVRETKVEQPRPGALPMRRKEPAPPKGRLRCGPVTVKELVTEQLQPVKLCAVLANEGTMDTKDVVQVYVQALDPDAPPHPILAAFQKVHVKAGEKKTVTINIPGSAFTVVDKDGLRHRASQFKIYAGCSQPDERSRKLTGEACIEICAS